MKNVQYIFRMFKKNPLLVFVNLPGLAIGLSAVLLLLVYINYELGFDKHFSTKDRVLRLYCKIVENTKSSNYGICLRKAFTEIPSKILEIEASTQLYRGGQVTIKSNNQNFNNLNLLYADQGFLNVFGQNLLYGDRTAALEGKQKIVISSSTAKKILGRKNCIGEVVTISDKPFIISGVTEDLPKNTHFNFDLLCSMQTLNLDRLGGLEFFTYYLIRKNSDIKQAGKKIANANDELMKPLATEFKITTKSGTEVLATLHTKSLVDFDLSPKADLDIILIVTGIAFFILFIAIINYVNLYVMLGEKRIGEIAIRKSMGANFNNLSGLFYSETGLMGFIAFILAIIIILYARPYFAQLIERPIEVLDFLSPSGIALILSLLIFLVLITGTYPSIYLSRMNVVNALKGKRNQITRKSKLSMAMVLLQFTVSIFLINSMLVIYSQLNYLKSIPLGFSPKNVVGITGLNTEVQNKFQTIQDELKSLPFIESVGSSFHYMGGGFSGQGIKVYGNPGKQVPISEYRVQQGFCETMKLELLDGGFFTSDKNDKNAVILNEAAAKMLDLKKPVGSLVQMHDESMKVIGLVKDFCINHSGVPIAPLVITDYSDKIQVIYFRVKDMYGPDEQRQVKAIFKKYDPDFITNYFLVTNKYGSKFYKEERIMKLVSTGSFLAILLSIVGLLALSILNVTHRTKEIGIRKISGSSEVKIMLALIRETFILVMVSMFLASIAGYFIMQHWLSNFVNKIPLHPGYFLLGGVIALVIALMTVSWQSWKAATRNPVEALRYE